MSKDIRSINLIFALIGLFMSILGLLHTKISTFVVVAAAGEKEEMKGMIK